MRESLLAFIYSNNSTPSPYLNYPTKMYILIFCITWNWHRTSIELFLINLNIKSFVTLVIIYSITDYATNIASKTLGRKNFSSFGIELWPCAWYPSRLSMPVYDVCWISSIGFDEICTEIFSTVHCRPISCERPSQCFLPLLPRFELSLMRGVQIA